jgi:sirohydrochlorin ferrochelatase
VRALTRLFAERAGAQYDKVERAFLELADPLIPAGVEALIETGTDDITVVPYFLSAGRHVVEDIPAEVAKVALPDGVSVRIAPYVAESGAMVDLLLEQGQAPGS